MPYDNAAAVPSYVPKDKRKQWMEVWNHAHAAALKDGKNSKDAEASAFAQANAVAGPNSDKKVAKSVDVHYEDVSNSDEQCQFCVFYSAGTCSNSKVEQDDKVATNQDGQKAVAATGWCDEYQHVVAQETRLGDPDGPKDKNITGTFKKFIKFEKVDASKREVWGIVTAEVPDKEKEVCDYDKSKPYYQEVIAEMSKATDGGNYMPLRAMHQPVVAGKCIGYEFRDADKEIFMGFKVTVDAEWKQVEEKVYTGFSHGGMKVGDMVPDPVYKDCMRYVAAPAEVSLVDNPCLGVAHFTYVSKTGQVELRKNRCVVEPLVSLEKFTALQTEVAELRKAVDGGRTSIIKNPPKLELITKEAKTKRVAGENLLSSAFLIVGDPEKTATWHLPVHFSSDAKTKRHIRNALARIGQVKGISEAQRESAKKRLHELASKHGINAEKEKALHAALFAHLRKLARVKVSRLARAGGDPGYSLTFLDSDLGRLSKGMYEVSQLARVVQELGNLVYDVAAEQEWEEDTTSPLPGMLDESMDNLLDVLLAMVQEESSELQDAVEMRLGNK